jgi:hypothetical protein
MEVTQRVTQKRAPDHPQIWLISARPFQALGSAQEENRRHHVVFARRWVRGGWTLRSPTNELYCDAMFLLASYFS